MSSQASTEFEAEMERVRLALIARMGVENYEKMMKEMSECDEFSFDAHVAVAKSYEKK
jgi:hypothetical protein